MNFKNFTMKFDCLHRSLYWQHEDGWNVLKRLLRTFLTLEKRSFQKFNSSIKSFFPTQFCGRFSMEVVKRKSLGKSSAALGSINL